MTGNGGGHHERMAFLLPNMRAGGAERVVLSLVEAFAHRRFEVDLVLVTAEGDFLSLVPAGVNIVDLGAKRFRGAIWPLVRYLRRRRPHALQARMWPLTIVAVLGRLLARVRTRLILCDDVPLTQQYGGSKRTFAILKATTRWFYPLAEARVLVSQGAAEDLARLSDIPRERLDVIYNPIPELTVSSGGEEANAVWGCVAGARIVSVGTLKDCKNYALLIQAFAELRRRRPARLMIVGEGDERLALEMLAVRLGVADDVLLPGYRDAPWALVASADLFALSSDYEGFGNVLVEAMRLGVPVVSTDCPTGPTEILDGGRFGELVPCNDPVAFAAAMERALRRPLEPAVLKERAEAISGAAVIDRYETLMLGPSFIRSR